LLPDCGHGPRTLAEIIIRASIFSGRAATNSRDGQAVWPVSHSDCAIRPAHRGVEERTQDRLHRGRRGSVVRDRSAKMLTAQSYRLKPSSLTA
jgi:hypothetical protein